MDPLKIIRHPSGTEKAIRMMDSENKLVFVVDRKARKAEIRRALEEGYGVKITKINTFITSKGEKKAYVKLAAEYPAIDLATKLGMM
jgi:large subunit ribosomal protein L23